MTPSKQAYDAIKKWEGLKLTAYECSAGKWTIGYGHTVGVKPLDTITEEEAEQLLVHDVETICIPALEGLALNQNQYDACTEFVFNIGATAFLKSTLYKLLLKGDYEGASNQFERWVYGNKKYIAGLHNRRLATKAMFEGEIND